MTAAQIFPAEQYVCAAMSCGMRGYHRECAVSQQEFPTRRPEVETHLLPDGTCLLFDPIASEGHVLNAVGALVWDYCDGTVSRGDMADEIGNLLPEMSQLRDEVVHLLDQFADLGLLLHKVA